MTEIAPASLENTTPPPAASEGYDDRWESMQETETHVDSEPRQELMIKHRTFEEAQQSQKKFSDQFIDNILAEEDGEVLAFRVGSEKVGLKGYLDKVDATPDDKAVISNPESIAAAYLLTTEMISRNLKIKVAKTTPNEIMREVSTSKQNFLHALDTGAPEAANKIVDWVETKDPRQAPRPGEAFGYYGFEVGKGSQMVDILEHSSRHDTEFHANIRIQRQGGGSFIFAYSDARIQERMERAKTSLDHRIYLNPTILETPGVFETLLQTANEAGIAIELKMLQRAEEVGAANIEKARDPSRGDALRGDGIVIYSPSESADDVLSMVLAIAQDSSSAFIGRKTSRIPQPVAEGIAVGCEPHRRPGSDAESLTSHRKKILSIVGKKVADSGKKGDDAREAFRRGVAYYAEKEGIDVNNIAFNAA